MENKRNLEIVNTILLSIITVLLFLLVINNNINNCNNKCLNDCITCPNCDNPTSNIEEEGIITEITPNGSYGSILVENGTFKAIVTINSNTQIFDEQKSNTVYKFSDLKENMKVGIIFNGPVAESYPVQGKAGTIIILGQN